MLEVRESALETGRMKGLRHFFFAAKKAEFSATHRYVRCSRSFAGVNIQSVYTQDAWEMIEIALPGETAGVFHHSFSTYFIRFNDRRVWQMQLSGKSNNNDAAKHCHWLALSSAYDQNLYFGGRGPEDYTRDGYIYSNKYGHPTDEWTRGVSYCRGFEEIRDPEGNLCIHYEYSSMKL